MKASSRFRKSTVILSVSFYNQTNDTKSDRLVFRRSLMTHASVPEDQRRLLGISDNMLRISVGLEDCRELAKDLYDALEKL